MGRVAWSLQAIQGTRNLAVATHVEARTGAMSALTDGADSCRGRHSVWRNFGVGELAIIFEAKQSFRHANRRDAAAIVALSDAWAAPVSAVQPSKREGGGKTKDERKKKAELAQAQAKAKAEAMQAEAAAQAARKAEADVELAKQKAEAERERKRKVAEKQREKKKEKRKNKEEEERALDRALKEARDAGRREAEEKLQAHLKATSLEVGARLAQFQEGLRRDGAATAVQDQDVVELSRRCDKLECKLEVTEEQVVQLAQKQLTTKGDKEHWAWEIEKSDHKLAELQERCEGTGGKLVELDGQVIHLSNRLQEMHVTVQKMVTDMAAQRKAPVKEKKAEKKAGEKKAEQQVVVALAEVREFRPPAPKKSEADVHFDCPQCSHPGSHSMGPIYYCSACLHEWRVE